MTQAAADHTHTLLTDAYSDALAALLPVVFDRAGEAYAVVDLDELDDESFEPADEARDRWRTARTSFEAVRDDPPFETDRGTVYRLIDDDGAFRTLAALTRDAVVGRWFLRSVVVTIDGRPVGRAVPHHHQLLVDAPRLGGDEFLAAATDALEGVPACLTPLDTRLEWRGEELRYRIRGGSLCVVDEDRGSQACWQLTRLHTVRLHPTDPELRVTWQPCYENDAIRLAGGTLARILPGPSIPHRLPCGDRATAEQALAVLRETLEAYDGRKL